MTAGSGEAELATAAAKAAWQQSSNATTASATAAARCWWRDLLIEGRGSGERGAGRAGSVAESLSRSVLCDGCAAVQTPINRGSSGDRCLLCDACEVNVTSALCSSTLQVWQTGHCATRVAGCGSQLTSHRTLPSSFSTLLATVPLSIVLYHDLSLPLSVSAFLPSLLPIGACSVWRLVAQRKAVSVRGGTILDLGALQIGALSAALSTHTALHPSCFTLAVTLALVSSCAEWQCRSLTFHFLLSALPPCLPQGAAAPARPLSLHCHSLEDHSLILSVSLLTLRVDLQSSIPLSSASLSAFTCLPLSSQHGYFSRH